MPRLLLLLKWELCSVYNGARLGEREKTGARFDAGHVPPVKKEKRRRRSGEVHESYGRHGVATAAAVD